MSRTFFDSVSNWKSQPMVRMQQDDLGATRATDAYRVGLTV